MSINLGSGYFLEKSKFDGRVIITKENSTVAGPRVQGIMNHENYISGWISTGQGIDYFLIEKTNNTIKIYKSLSLLNQEMKSLNLEPLDMAKEMTYYDYVKSREKKGH